jgi:NADPH:quinone reductase-like Zn-dependent oxidoreductase
MTTYMKAVGQTPLIQTLNPPKLTCPSPDIKPTPKGEKVPASALYINPETPIPELHSATHALVHVKAFGLNRMDLMQRQGVYPLPPQAPKTMGVEFSGVIVKLGPGTRTEGESYKVGDEVFGLAYGGMSSILIKEVLRM